MSPSQQLSGLAMTTSGALRWLLAMSLLAPACTTGPDLTPVQQPGQRMQFDGFSVLPPQGERWYVAPTLPKDEMWRSVAGFVKQGSNDAPGTAIWATAAVANVDTPFPSREQLLQQLARLQQSIHFHYCIDERRLLLHAPGRREVER